MDKEFLKGNLDIMLLSLIYKKDTYGYEIVKNLKEISNDTYTISEGTLYPALKRLEKNGWIYSYWGDSETGGRRKYYLITDLGQEELQNKINQWRQVNDLIHLCTEGMTWVKGSKHTLNKS